MLPDCQKTFSAYNSGSFSNIRTRECFLTSKVFFWSRDSCEVFLMTSNHKKTIKETWYDVFRLLLKIKHGSHVPLSAIHVRYRQENYIFITFQILTSFQIRLVKFKFCESLNALSVIITIFSTYWQMLKNNRIWNYQDLKFDESNSAKHPVLSRVAYSPGRCKGMATHCQAVWNFG